MIDTPLPSTKFEGLEGEYAEQHFPVTKFKHPVASHTLQTRTRLLTLLRRGLLYPLTLVSAPAGFGKTTVLSQWTQSLTDENTSVAWVSLDESDNEPVRFWNVLLSALAQKLPVFGSPQIHEGVRSVSALLTLFINTCAVQQEPIVLVLDDYHTITDSAVQGQMTYFIEHLPSHVHVVLSTRVDPCLPLARLRVRQQMLEVRTPALRFTCEEAKCIKRVTAGSDKNALSASQSEGTKSRRISRSVSRTFMMGLPASSGWITATQCTAPQPAPG